MKSGFALLPLLFFLFSCKFTPNGVSDVEVKPIPSVTVKTIDLLNVADTLLLYDHVYLKYAINAEGNQDLKVKAHFIEKDILSSSNANGSIELNPDQYKDGIYELILTAITNTGTGSLADKVGAEKLLFEKKWTVIIDKDPPILPKITAIKESGGRLRIEWEKYNRPNFSRYIINVSIKLDPTYGVSNFNTYTNVYYVTNADQTALVDSNYAGGELKVSLDIQRLENDIHWGKPVTFNDERSTVKQVKQLPDGKLKITWNKNKYYANFSHYSLNYYHYSGNTYFKSENINDTTAIIDDVGFGESTPFILLTSTSEKYATCCKVFLTTSANVYPGEVFTPYYRGYFTKKSDVFFTHQDGNILRWKSGRLENKIAEFYPSPFLSPNGERIYIKLLNKSIQEIDPYNFTTKTTYFIDDAMDSGSNGVYQLTASDTNIIFFALEKYLNRNFYYYVLSYDTQLKSIRDTIIMQGYVSKLLTNAKGNRLIRQSVTKSHLLKVENGQFIDANTPFILEGSNPQFNPLNEDEIYTFTTNTMKVYDALNMQFKKEVSLPVTLNNIQIDKVTGNIGGHASDNYFYCLSPETGSILAKIRLNITPPNIILDLHNNMLYSSKGYKLDLNTY